MNAKKYRNWMVKQALRRQRIKDFHAGGPKVGGKSMAEVAAQFRISRGRAWQIVRDYVK
jgi:hypothetical protein